MAGKRNEISVPIKGEADFGGAVRDIEQSYDRMERGARETAKDIEADFEKATVEIDVDDRQLRNAERDFEDFTRKLKDGSDVELEVDEAQLQQAFKLAEQLDGLVAELTIDADTAQLNEADRLARALRSFTAKINLDVDGRAELREALGLSEALDAVRQVRVQVEGRQELERAQQIADDLERRRSVPIDAQASDLVRLDDQIEAALTSGGEAGAEGVAGALGDIDFGDIGRSGLDQLTGALAAAGPWAAVGAGIGAIFGDEFLEGFQNALPSGRADTIRALRSNLSEAEMAEVGEAGGAAYSAGLSEGLSDAKDAAALIKGELGAIDDDLDLTQVTRQATALEQVFGVDLADSVASVDKLVSQGLVRNSEEGFNLLFELGQQTQGQFGEMLELTDEFSTAIKALGIDGPKGLKLIGDMVEQGIFPQVDQAGEVFEELNETIINGGAADALADIGFNAEEMQRTIAGGGPKAAAGVADIAAALLNVDDNAKQAQLTTAIFGGNMGLLGDDAREAALELFATADGTAAVGTAASDGADAIEESASGLDRLKKVAVELGNELGGTVADGIETLNSLAEMDFKSAADSAASFGEALGISLLGPLGEIADRGPDWLDPFGKLKESWHELTDEAPPAVAGAEALSTAAREGAPQIEEMADASGELAGGLDEASVAADELEAELRGLFDFSADQLFRDIAEAGDELAATLKDGGAEAVGLGGSIDISTEAGRRLQEQMEGLTDILIDAGVAQADGSITADQLASAHSILRDQLESTGRAAGLTTQEVDDLIAKYLNVPSEVVTKLRAQDEATQVVKNLQNALSGLKDKTITVTTRNAVIAATAATAKARAKGGPTRGLTLVGEEGPELVDFQGQAYVYNANDTKAIIRGAATSGSLAERSTVAQAPAAAGKRVFAEHATFVVDKGVDLWQQADLAEQVYATL